MIPCIDADFLRKGTALSNRPHPKASGPPGGFGKGSGAVKRPALPHGADPLEHSLGVGSPDIVGMGFWV